MGGHWGTSSAASDGSIGTVRARQVADALENWTYSARPSDRDAVVRRLSEAFPRATIRREEGAADAVVDGVHVLVVHRLDSTFRRDFHALADRADELVVYSTTCHTSAPNEWREFRHRYRGRHGGATVQFAHRREPTAGSGISPARALAFLSLSLVAISGLLAASLGLFGTAASAPASASTLALPSPVGPVALGGIVGAVLVASLAYLLTRPRIYVSLLRRLPHT